MNVTHMIGQLLVMGFHGNTVADPGYAQMKHYIHQGLVGGVIFFRYNIDTPETLAEIATGFKLAVQGPDPLLTSIDQEGGLVQRLDPRHGYPRYPKAIEYAALSAEERINVSYEMAQGLARVGVNLNYAPVVDLHDDQSAVIGHYGRAYSRNPEEVARCASDFITGHHKAGVLTCLKHFPGHGLALKDSHKGLVDISSTVHPDELAVYETMMAHHAVDMIMTAHVHNAHVDPVFPATLSEAYVNGLLRQKMGYDGVVITDDLQMGAILQHYPVEKALILALQAGCDLMIISQNAGSAGGVSGFKAHPDMPEKLHAVVEAALQAGEITLDMLQTAYGRVQRLKAKLVKG